MSWPWNQGQRSLKVIETDTYRSATCDFLLTFHSNHWPISYRFRDKRRFQSKIANFSHPVYFVPLLKGFPWELGVGARGQKTRMMSYRAEKEVWRYLQPSGYNAPTWRTDGRTDRHRATAKTARRCAGKKHTGIPVLTVKMRRRKPQVIRRLITSRPSRRI